MQDGRPTSNVSTTMIRHRVSATRRIPAPPQVVYDILADYRHGHPSILPPQFFQNLEVLEGGFGAGTTIRFEMKVMGRPRASRAVITEPDPGHVIAERYPENDAVTIFSVKPLANDAECRVTILTALYTRGGPVGFVERWAVTQFLRKVYEEELRLLEQFARERVRSTRGPGFGRRSGATAIPA